MGPLTRRIQHRRAQVAVTSIMRQAARDSRIATALHIDEKRDGGLLVHLAIEKAEGKR